MNGLKDTQFQFTHQTQFYRGKVRDVYYFNDKMAVVATDRISAFDVVMPYPIPYKGQVLNQVAAQFLQATREVVPNWLISTPHPMVSIGYTAQPYKVEMVIRGYLSGHAWREYKSGKRSICGEPLPDGLCESDKLPQPIITPTTKAAAGHDEDISKDDIIKNGLVSKQEYEQLEAYTHALYAKGQEIAHQNGLILVDTKYEFGKIGNTIVLIDEVHTPDSSRYFYEDGYHERQEKKEPQKQLSKEFVRQWLIENGFQGKEGQTIPAMSGEFINTISQRYIELYEQVTGKSFQKINYQNIEHQIKNAIESNI